MIAFKAVYQDMSSQFGDKPVYEMGKTYIFPIAEIGRGGFHAAEDPLFCLNFIPPDKGRYFKVELQGRLDTAGGVAGADSAAAAERLTLLEELTVEQMLWYSMKYRLAWAKLPVHKNANGERVMAVTDKADGLIEASGTKCVAVAQGKDSTAKACGPDSLAIAEGPGSKACATGYRALAVAFGREASLVIGPGTWGLRIIPDAPPEGQLAWIQPEQKQS